MPEPFDITGIFARNVPGMTEALRDRTVGIAGCGGLGSNAAIALVRAGVGRLVLVDHDRVELSNLNRQHYFQRDIGRPKVHALRDHLTAIRPGLGLVLHDKKLEQAEVGAVFRGADLLIEAFDRAESKRWLIEAWCAAFPERFIVCGSGLSGLASSESIRVRRAGRLIVVGDQQSDLSEGLCSARVAAVANLQALAAIRALVGDASC